MDFIFNEGSDRSAEVWVALHGSSRDETDMVSLVRDISPDAAILSLRGTLPHIDGFAHFRRDLKNRPDRVDLRERCEKLEIFIGEYTAGFLDGRDLVLCGFSNGAVMGAALLLRGKSTFSAALLFRPMLPVGMTAQRLKLAIPVLLVDAVNDRRRRLQDAVSLSNELKKHGARVSIRSAKSEHAPTPEDIRIASCWLQDERHRAA